MGRQAVLDVVREHKPARAGDVAQREQAWARQREAAGRCRECPLFAHATQTVWGEGPIGARLMLVGETPGDQEDEDVQGHPFVGPAGRLLDRALAELGWDRSIAYVTNAVKHFKWVPAPRGKRRMHKTPAQREADACEHWLESEIALVRERGQWLARDDGLPVLITLHRRRCCACRMTSVTRATRRG
jgi:uracil-DNA glycosylase